MFPLLQAILRQSPASKPDDPQCSLQCIPQESGTSSQTRCLRLSLKIWKMYFRFQKYPFLHSHRQTEMPKRLKFLRRLQTVTYGKLRSLSSYKSFFRMTLSLHQMLPLLLSGRCDTRKLFHFLPPQSALLPCGFHLQLLSR